MPIPTEPVGSLPRPMKLRKAFVDAAAGKIKHEELEREQDAACPDSIKRSEATGEPIVSDGEQRMSSFATYRLPTRWREPAWPAIWRWTRNILRSSRTGIRRTARGGARRVDGSLEAHSEGTSRLHR